MRISQLTDQAGEKTRFGDTIRRLLDEAKQEAVEERRAHARHPFFRLVSISPNGDPSQRFSAFTRELSFSGVGLLHCMPVESGEVLVTIPSKQGNSVQLRTRILWCRSCGEGWYLSGGQFI